MMKSAIIDANVFVTAWTLDVLLTLAEKGLFEPHWSPRIIAEARRAYARAHGAEAPSGLWDAIDVAFPYSSEAPEGEPPAVALPDSNDIHVAHAALSCAAGTIVTYNTKDFPESALRHLGLDCTHPDNFLMELTSNSPDAVREAVESLVADKRRPPRTMAEEIAGLRRNGLARFAEWLENNE